MKLAVMYFPADYPEFLDRGFLQPIMGKLKGLSHERRNPRNDVYLRTLAEEILGPSARIEELRILSRRDFESADEIILLWPDGNGYGWFAVERKILTYAWQAGIPVKVLNGRRRFFQLRGFSTLLPYWTKRNLERFWVGEALFMIVFLVVTPVLLVWDYSWGRR